MSFNILITPAFEKAIKKLSKKYPSIKSDLKQLLESLKITPNQGTPLGKDCFKIRMAITSKGKGKSGGARVITCVKVTAANLFLITIYDKSEQEDISDKELDNLLYTLGLS